MKTRIRKWGNSLALRIPKSFAAEAGLREDVPIELSLVKGKLIIQPLGNGEESLEEMLRRITPENRHDKIDFGPPVGKEIW